MRTLERPVAGSTMEAKGSGTKWPPCIDTTTPLPPAIRYLAAQ